MKPEQLFKALKEEYGFTKHIYEDQPDQPVFYSKTLTTEDLQEPGYLVGMVVEFNESSNKLQYVTSNFDHDDFDLETERGMHQALEFIEKVF